MKPSRLTCAAGVALALIIAACTSPDIEAPVNSSELVDEDVEYSKAAASSGAPEDAGTAASPPIAALGIGEEEFVVVSPPPAVEDDVVDFVNEAYAPQTDAEFELAVRDAEARRGIKPSAPAPKAAAKPEFKGRLEVKEAPMPRHESITFLSAVIYHSNSQADMTEKDMRAIREVAKFARAHDARVRVVGHASSRTRDMKEAQNRLVNFDLSIERAGKVASALARAGVAKDRVLVSAVSDTEKIASENMPLNEAVNRRTEIYVSY